MGPTFFLVGILWIQDFFLSVFRRSEILSLWYLVGPIFFLVGILWFQDFFSLVFGGSGNFSRGIIIFKMNSSHDNIFFIDQLIWLLLMALNILGKLRKTDQMKKFLDYVKTRLLTKKL